MSSGVRVSVAQTSSALPRDGYWAEMSQPPRSRGRKRLEHASHGAVEQQHGLVETRPVECEAHAAHPRQRLDQLGERSMQVDATWARPCGPSSAM